MAVQWQYMIRERQRAVTIRMSDVEVEKLKALAGPAGISASDVVRQWVRYYYARTISKDPPKKPKR